MLHENDAPDASRSVGAKRLPLIAPAAKPAAGYRAWDPRYLEVVQSLVAAMAPLPLFLEIEHVGSTAIPGCGGKGVIDLLALYPADFLEQAKAYLLTLGFGRQGGEFSRAWPESRPMLLGNYSWRGEAFLIYVHVVSRASDEVRRFRAFKERLIQDQDLVAKYCATKQAIVSAGVTDTDEYAKRKRPFMRYALGAEHALRPNSPGQP